MTTFGETPWNHSSKITRHTVRGESITNNLDNLKNRAKILVQIKCGFTRLTNEMENALDRLPPWVRQFLQRKQRSFTKSTLYNHIFRCLSLNSKYLSKSHGNDWWTHGFWQTPIDIYVTECKTLCMNINACAINSTSINKRCLYTGLECLDLLGCISNEWVSIMLRNLELTSVPTTAGRDRGAVDSDGPLVVICESLWWVVAGDDKEGDCSLVVIFESLWGSITGRVKTYRLSPPATVIAFSASKSLRIFFTYQRTGEPLEKILKMSGT